MKVNGSLIRRKRILAGHGLRRFAAKIRITPGTLGSVELGRHDPRPETVKRIADGLGCSIEELLADESDCAA